MMKTAIAFAAALFALVAIPEYASAHQPCGWKRNHYGQRVWVCTQQPAVHYYRRNPPRAYRQSVVVAVPVYAPVQRYNVPMHGQICPQTGQVLPQTALQQPAHTQSGLNIHAANTAPQGSKPCTQVINGVTVTGRCW